MADVAKRLVGPIALSTSSTTVYTAPTGVTTIVRSIHAACTAVSNMTFNLAIGASASTVANCFFYQQGVPMLGSFEWSGFLVLNAGESVAALGSLAGITLVVNGIEVS